MSKKIVFLQTIPLELTGVEALAAVLSEHQLQVIITYIDSYSTVVKKLERFQPDLICFSCTTSDHYELLRIARRLKERFTVPYIWGGPHATFFPEIIQESGVDVVVRGEAEHILPKLVSDLSDTSIPSCWFKRSDGAIIRNEMGSLIKDLDAIPFPDRSLYRKYYPSLPYSCLTMIAGRGCPFNCSFCYNRALKKMFAGDLRSGHYVRLRRPARVIEEIEDYIKRFGRPRYVKLQDDTLIFNRTWIMEFLDLYQKRIGIPFTCLGRADLMDEALAKALKNAGIVCFFWAVETGNERLRKEVLKKNISDEQILNCGKLLNQYRIPFRVYNMMGVPQETWEDALSTVEINRKINNPYPLCTIYDPYPGTELAETAAATGLLADLHDSGGYGKIQYGSTLLKLDPRLVRIQMLFYYFVRFPRLDRFLRRWIQKDHRVVNQFLFYPAYAWVFWRTYKYTLREMFTIVWRTARPLMGLEADVTDKQVIAAPSAVSK